MLYTSEEHDHDKVFDHTAEDPIRRIGRFYNGTNGVVRVHNELQVKAPPAN